MTVKVRFAPSPTGRLHMGNARVALVNWLFSRQHGGRFLLRLDDTDRQRCDPAFEEAIYLEMEWLGLVWDESFRQSAHVVRYEAAAERLKETGWLYPCYETPEELALKRKTRLNQGLPPVYDREALTLTDAQKRAYEAEGRQPYWRFKLDQSPITWDDRVRGAVTFDAGSLSDPVLVRSDGRPLYSLSSVVDDGEGQVTDIVRGEDHVANTACQVQIFQALGYTVPAFAHLPLLTDSSGDTLSKRLTALSLDHLRDELGVEAMAVNSLLARLGTDRPLKAEDHLEPLIAEFDFGAFARGTPKFDERELLRLNERLVHNLDFETVQPRLQAMGLSQLDRAFWEAVRANLETVAEVATWWRICREPVTPAIDSADGDFLKRAAELLPAELDEGAWQRWTEALKQETGRKGAKLFKPLRRALTGEAAGPELANLLPLIGLERAAKRLRGETA